MSDEFQESPPWEPTQQQTQTQVEGPDDELHEPSSQSQPWTKYWAIFIPMHSSLAIYKLKWELPKLSFGRRPENDVVLTERRVSSNHCKIVLGEHTEGEEPIIFIEDLKSSNGTFVNSHRLAAGGRRRLIHGDEISLGNSSVSGVPDIRWVYVSVGKPGKIMPSVGGVYEEYALMESLGSGTFAEVKRAIHLETGDTFACKIIKKHKFVNHQSTLKMFKREIEILQSLRHPNICEYVNHYEDPGHIYVILEYVDGGDLLGYINGYTIEKNGLTESASLPESHAADLSLMLCQAIAYIHDKHVTHRDLKPENILLTKPDKDGNTLVKVADFGLAKMVNPGSQLRSLVGTPQYIAPEVLMQEPESPGYEDVVDSWSVGIVIYTMLTKMLPFDDEADIPVSDQIRNRYYNAYASPLLREHGISETAIDFIDRLLEKEPTRRMTMRQALHHPWLRDRHLAAGGVESQSQGHRELTHQSSFGSIISVDTDHCTTPRPDRIKHRAGEHDEDFSQPLRDLRLNTPRVAENHQIRHDSSFYSGPSDSMVEDSDPQSAFFVGKAPIVNTVAPVRPDPADPVSSPAVKRKITAVFAGGPAANFSSGELSPPPPESRASPSTAPATPLEKPTATQAEGKGRAKRISDAHAAPTRSSPRLSASATKKARTEADDGSSGPSGRSTRSRR